MEPANRAGRRGRRNKGPPGPDPTRPDPPTLRDLPVRPPAPSVGLGSVTVPAGGGHSRRPRRTLTGTQPEPCKPLTPQGPVPGSGRA